MAVLFTIIIFSWLLLFLSNEDMIIVFIILRVKCNIACCSFCKIWQSKNPKNHIQNIPPSTFFFFFKTYEWVLKISLFGLFDERVFCPGKLSAAWEQLIYKASDFIWSKESTLRTIIKTFQMKSLIICHKLRCFLITHVTSKLKWIAKMSFSWNNF